MKTKFKKEKSEKEFLKTKIKSTTKILEQNIYPKISSNVIEEQIFIGHSRNSRKLHYFQGSRD
jgi:hypothetical protein